MQIDDQLISRLENLARLQLSPEERAQLRGDLNDILQMVEQLKEVDVEGVEPLAYINAPTHRLRADQVQDQVDRERALANAPDQDGTFFRVPKVIDL